MLRPGTSPLSSSLFIPIHIGLSLRVRSSWILTEQTISESDFTVNSPRSRSERTTSLPRSFSSEKYLLFAHWSQTGPSSYASRPQQRRKHITCERLTSGTSTCTAAFGNCLPKVGYQGSSDPRTMALLILRACDRPCPPYGWKLRQSLSIVNGGSSRVGEHLRRTTVDEKEGEQQRSLLYH